MAAKLWQVEASAIGRVLDRPTVNVIAATAHSLSFNRDLVRAVADAVPGMLAYWDIGLRCRFANRRYLEWFGMAPEAIIGQTMVSLLDKQVYAASRPYVRAALAGVPQQFERVRLHSDGSVSYIHASYTPDLRSAGEVFGLFMLESDVTALRRAEAELRLARGVFESTVDAIIVTDDFGVIEFANPALTTITGYRADELIGQNLAMLRARPGDPALHHRLCDELALDGHWERDVWQRRKNGELFLGHHTTRIVRRLPDEPLRYVSVMTDVTEISRRNEAINRLAYHDALTGLPNRALLMDRLGEALLRAQREKRAIALLFVDLDGFKQVNDAFGHAAGDEMLRTVGDKLRGAVRQVDTVSRLGGDEFVVLLDNPASEDEVVRVAIRMLAAINAPSVCAQRVAQVAASIGIAFQGEEQNSATELMKQADHAMYQAKRRGRNNYVVFKDCLSNGNPRATPTPVRCETNPAASELEPDTKFAFGWSGSSVGG